jgi:hypothetical protein
MSDNTELNIESIIESNNKQDISLMIKPIFKQQIELNNEQIIEANNKSIIEPNNEQQIESIIEPNNESNNEQPIESNNEPNNESIIEQIIKESNNNEIELTNLNSDIDIESANLNLGNDIKSANINIDKFKLNQDNMQRISVGLQFLLELYRVITSSLLILFVPQMCVDHVCTISENLVWESNIYNTALIFNFISMFSLIFMYIIEIRRENRLIKYLDVNIELPNDNDEVGKKLEQMPINHCKKIYSIDRYYQLSSYVATFIYLLNIIFSAIIVNEFYAGSQSSSTFITYVLFMAMKLYSVYTITSTDKNIFYSAYMKTNVQFNDLDQNYKLII